MTTQALATDSPAIGRLQQRALLVGIVGLIAGGIGAVLQRGQLMPSLLIGFIFCLGLSLGSLSMLMMQHLTGGQWGLVARRVYEAGTRVLPYCVLLFLPIAFALPTLYVWARPGAGADEILRHKQLYLNPWFFYARAVLYFVVWLGCAYYLNRWSLQQDRGEAAVTDADTRRFRVVSAPGLLLYVILMTFASIDWIMSLDAHWFSTIFGFIMVAGQALAGMGFAIAVLATIANEAPMNAVLRPVHFHDLGKLLLAFVMLWAYFSFSQFLIIWAGNLPEEITFYLVRLRNGWQYLSLLIVVGHFALPFSLLLSRDLKRHARSLARIAWFIVAMRLVDVIWLIAPNFNEGARLPVSLANVAIPVGLAGIWVFLFAGQLRSRALVPVNDPYFKEMLAHGHHAGH